MHFQYAFLMAPRFSKNMHFSMGKCLCVYFLGWLQKTLTSSIVQINISLNYAFLMVPGLSRNMHFSSGKCIFFAFWLTADNAYFIFRWFCSNQGFYGTTHFWWFQDFPNISIFSMGKCICLLFGWLQNWEPLWPPSPALKTRVKTPDHWSLPVWPQQHTGYPRLD